MWTPTGTKRAVGHIIDYIYIYIYDMNWLLEIVLSVVCTF